MINALDTIKYPALTQLERSDEERQRDFSNQYRLNNNFRKIEDSLFDLTEGKASIDYVVQQIHDALDLRIESQTFVGTQSNVTVSDSALVTSSMYVKSWQVVDPKQMLSDLSWTTNDGNMKVTGNFTLTGTKIIFYLSEVR